MSKLEIITMHISYDKINEFESLLTALKKEKAKFKIYRNSEIRNEFSIHVEMINEDYNESIDILNLVRELNFFGIISHSVFVSF